MVRNGILNGAIQHLGTQHVVVIDGAPQIFSSVQGAYYFARRCGLDIKLSTFCRRLEAGQKWEDIIKPGNKNKQKAGAAGGVVGAASRKRARDEMHELCVELDRRKAEIANG